MKASFVKTIILLDNYKEVEEIGDMVVCHFDPREVTMTDGEGNEVKSIDCCEGSCSKSEYSAEGMQEAYDAWKERMKARSLSLAIQSKLVDIDSYDQSDKVNGFKLNGMTVWLDKATRVGLMNSTTIAKSLGNETTDLWLNGYKLTVNCDTAIQLLSSLEMYALECFNVTAAHKKAVAALESVEEVQAYDYTTGYPDQLSMNI